MLMPYETWKWSPTLRLPAEGHLFQRHPDQEPVRFCRMAQEILHG